MQRRDGGDEGEPEPEEDVDLLVDDVEGEDAEAVFLLDRAGGTVLEERALRDLREHLGHRVGPVQRQFVNQSVFHWIEHQSSHNPLWLTRIVRALKSIITTATKNKNLNYLNLT